MLHLTYVDWKVHILLLTVNNICTSSSRPAPAPTPLDRHSTLIMLDYDLHDN